MEKDRPAEANPLSLLEEQEKNKLLKELIEELSPTDQLFIRLLYYEGAAPGEIARIFKTTQGAVYSRGNYIREKLKGALKQKVSKKNA